MVTALPCEQTFLDAYESLSDFQSLTLRKIQRLEAGLLGGKMIHTHYGRFNFLLACFVTVAVVALPMLAAVGPAAAGLTGRALVAGYGPELPLLQDLGKAFEKSHPGTAIDFEWDKNVKAVDLVQSGTADIAVTDHLVTGLHASQIAWDGVAVIVNFANPIRELTSRQVKAIFGGQMMRWSEIDGANEKIEILDRAPEDNVKAGFEASLGITNQIPPSALVVRTDQKALRAVSGKRSAITYLSLAAALRAQEDGIPIQVLTLDGVEPGQPTLRNGTYGIRRPIYLLSQERPGSVAESFLAFAQSAEAEQYMKSVYIPSGNPSGIGTKDLGRLDQVQPHTGKQS